MGFHCNLGAATSVSSELWGLVLGLKLARNLACQRIVAELDSSVVVQMLQMKRSNFLPLKPLLDEVVALIDEANARIVVNHVYREAKRSADFMATLAHSGTFSCSVLHDPLLYLFQFS